VESVGNFTVPGLSVVCSRSGGKSCIGGNDGMPIGLGLVVAAPKSPIGGIGPSTEGRVPLSVRSGSGRASFIGNRVLRVVDLTGPLSGF
jgi:hypothetical protein